MAFPQVIDAIYLALVGTTSLRTRRWPLNAAGKTLTGDKTNLGKVGAYVAVVAISTIDSPSWLYGAQLSSPDATQAATVTDSYFVDVSTGGAGVEAASSLSGVSGTPSGVFTVAVYEKTDVGKLLIPPATLPTWIKLVNQPRLSAALAQITDATANATWNVALLTAAGIQV